MSDLQKTIEIIFQGRDDLTGSLKQMENSLNSFSSGLQDIGAPFLSAVEKVAMLNAAIAGIAVAGVAASSDIENEALKMQRSLGLPIEEAERFEEIAKEVYKAGYGDDLAAAFEAVTLAQKRFGDSAEVDIGRVTEEALRLQSVFGTDINESLGAVKTLMSNFGLTATEAMGFIVAGFQEGLNGSNDFLESINEYATQFSNGGADAAQFFSVMESGFQEGMLGTDRAADAFKEFRVRIQDESKTTNDALQSLGLDPEEFAAKMAAGEMSAIDAFNIIQQKLNETEDETIKFNAGVGLMGTQFEDLGTEAALAINTTSKSLGDLNNSLNEVDTDSFTKKFSSAMRTITTEFGDMKVWEDVKDNVSEVFLDIARSFDESIDTVDFSGVASAFGEIWETLRTSLADQNLDITSVEGMKNALELIADSLESVAHVTEGIVEAFEPAFDVVIGITKKFNDLDPDMQEIVGSIMGLGAALGILGSVVAVGGALLSGIAAFVGFFSTGGALSVGISGVIGLLTGPAGLAAALMGVATVGANFFTGEEFQEWAVNTKKAIADADFGEWAEKTRGYFQDVSRTSAENLSGMDASLLTVGQTADSTKENIKGLADGIDLIPAHKQTDIAVDADTETIESVVAGLDTIPSHKNTDVTATADPNELAAIGAEIDSAIPDEKTTNAKMAPDTDSVENTKGLLETAAPPEKKTNVLAQPDFQSFNTTKSAINEIPESKMMEIQLQGDIDIKLAEIEARAETVQTAFEWQAKVDIAEAEADAKRVVAAFEAASEAVAATAAAAADMYGSLLDNWDKLGWVEKRVFEQYLQEQMAMEREALEMQKELTDAQIEYMNAKADALRDGEGLIKIESDGLEPALEMIMWQIMEKVQLRVNEESAEFLLGLNPTT